VSAEADENGPGRVEGRTTAHFVWAEPHPAEPSEDGRRSVATKQRWIFGSAALVWGLVAVASPSLGMDAPLPVIAALAAVLSLAAAIKAQLVVRRFS
jgi:hypothetical protein